MMIFEFKEGFLRMYIYLWRTLLMNALCMLSEMLVCSGVFSYLVSSI